MKDTMIGVDLAKNVFQVHGASMTGHVKFRKKLTRLQFLRSMAEQPPAVVVMEACGSASYWAREMAKLGHEVKLIAPQYVRPNVQAPEERHGRCRGDRDRCAAPRDALRRAEVGKTSRRVP